MNCTPRFQTAKEREAADYDKFVLVGKLYITIENLFPGVFTRVFFFPGNTEVWKRAELSPGTGLSAKKHVFPPNPFRAASPRFTGSEGDTSG